MAEIRITICGATGKQGTKITEHLLSTGRYRVTALSRNLESPASRRLALSGAAVLRADMLSQSSISDVIKEHDIVFLIVQTWSVLKGQYDAAKEILQAKNVIWASREAGVRHLVYHSFIRAGEIKAGIGFLDSKLVIEKLISESGLSFTIIRYGPWLETLQVDRYRHAITGNYGSQRAVPYSSLADVGPVAARIAAQPELFNGKTVSVIADMCTGVQLAASADDNSDHSFNYRAANLLYQRLTQPDTYRLRRYLEHHRESFSMQYDDFKSGYPDIFAKLTDAAGFLSKQLL